MTVFVGVLIKMELDDFDIGDHPNKETHQFFFRRVWGST